VPDTRFEAWEVVLDRIELDLIRAQRALDTGVGLGEAPDEWDVPEGYGPIPTALRSRAEEIIRRQQHALRRMATQLGVTAQHQALVEGFEALSTGPGARPVYVDARF
jgi:hypothetical protein